MRIELGFEMNTSCQSEFSRYIKAHFDPNKPILLSWINTLSLKRKPFVLEAGASSPLLSSEN
jgi:hypothetical protein